MTISKALDDALAAAGAAQDGEMSVSETGAMRKNRGKPRFDLIPPSWGLVLARILTFGARKYEDRNWEKGLPIMETLASAERHLNKVKRGELIDADSGEPNLGLAAWNALAAMECLRRIDAGTLPASLDDRPKEWRDAEHAPPEGVCEDCSNSRACADWGQCIARTMRENRAACQGVDPNLADAQTQANHAAPQLWSCSTCIMPAYCRAHGPKCSPPLVVK
jgi:hypothetical protein